MSRLRIALIVGALLAGLVGLARLTAADSDAKTTEENLDVRYARALYQMAEANMHKVERTNQRFPKTVSEAVINEYGEDLAVAKAQLDALQAVHPSFFAAWVRRAESNMRSAEAYYKSATATNTRQPGSVDALDLERLRLRVEVTRLQVERGKLLVNASPDKKLQWQVQFLGDEVARLKEQTSRIAPQTRVYPWRY